MNTATITHKYIKPSLEGGTAPNGLEWTALLTSRHSRLLLSSLGHHRKVPISRVLEAALMLYQDSYKAEIDVAFKKYSTRYDEVTP